MKKTQVLAVIMVMMLTFCSCSSRNVPVDERKTKEDIMESGRMNEVPDVTKAVSEESDTEWVIYWYLCGSNLESENGEATSDLSEMMQVNLPENVKVVIETGGTIKWDNDAMSADKIQRYVYDQTGMHLIEEKELASMGDAETLEDFLRFASTRYPAKHTMIQFWNHGGGSVNGVCFDEIYGMDSLTLQELYDALTSVYMEDVNQRPIDLIGFDACLMASVDAADLLSNLADYMIASEEVEPGNGWYYTSMLQALADNPAIEPLEFAKMICDGYLLGCREAETEDEITLSVTNLEKVHKLLESYDEFGRDILHTSIDQAGFYAKFTRIAQTSENYGGNTREQGYSNMVDLGHLARMTREYLPETADKVMKALDECIEYKVQGKYRQESTGLSCYYSYNGDVEELDQYYEINSSDAFAYLYSFALTGELPEEGMEYIEGMNYSSLPEMLTVNDLLLDQSPVYVDEKGYSVLDLGKNIGDYLSGVTFRLYYVGNEDDVILCLGTDNDMESDWEQGVFRDNFRGVWGSIDGHLCYMELEYESPEYNLYTVPVLLNDESYNLSVAYDFRSQDYRIQGARKAIDECGAADKNLRSLVPGDRLELIHYASTLSDAGSEFSEVPIERLFVTENTKFSEMELGDGTFLMVYEMTDCQGNIAYSIPVNLEISNGEIITTVEE